MEEYKCQSSLFFFFFLTTIWLHNDRFSTWPSTGRTMLPFVVMIEADIMLETIQMGITCCWGMPFLRISFLLNERRSDLSKTMRWLFIVAGCILDVWALHERRAALLCFAKAIILESHKFRILC